MDWWRMESLEVHASPVQAGCAHLHMEAGTAWQMWLWAEQVAHDEDGGTSITFAEALDVSGPEAVAGLLKQAMRQRAVGATAMNERSSRSHMVFALRLRGTNATTGIQAHGKSFPSAFH